MLIQNKILNNTYQIIRPIGHGGTSSVFLAYHLRLRKNVVIKQLRGSFSDDFLMRTEVDILKNLHHTYLPQVYDFFQEKDEVYSVIDFVDGYDLGAYIESGTRFPEQLLKRYLRQIADVLDYLHSQNPSVIHSDIKPGNVIINCEGNAILIDFNTSIGGNQGNLLGLTIPYASPEQIELAQCALYGREVTFDLDGRSDLFSLGATFYELISGIRPMPGVPPVPLHTMGLTEYSRDFLVLIDRLIEYDREKRLKSAKKLVAAIDRIGSSYRAYFALRCVSLLVSAAFIGGGLYCCIRGARQGVLENYRQYYSSATSLVAQGCLDQAEQVCDQIIESDKMQAYLQDNPAELAKFYHLLGDISYYDHDFAMASAYYRQALSFAKYIDGDSYVIYLRDAAIAFAQYGDLETAQSLLESARSNSAGGNDLLLITMVISARQGNVAVCLDMAQQIISSGADKQTCFRAAVTAASAVQDLNTRIAWLQVARQYDEGRTALRGLAVAYGEKSQNAASAVERDAAVREALTLYEQLCDSHYASSTDMLNYSIILRMSGQLDQALAVLKSASEFDSQNYRILANMCFLYYELNDSSNASRCCEEAIRAWHSYTASDKLSEASEEIQNLMEMARRFGIGGM